MDFQFKKEPEAFFRPIKMRKKLPLCEMIDLVVGVDCDRMDPKPEPVIYLQVDIRELCEQPAHQLEQKTQRRLDRPIKLAEDSHD